MVAMADCIGYVYRVYSYDTERSYRCYFCTSLDSYFGWNNWDTFHDKTMIYTPSEYAVTFTFGGVHLSERSIRRRCFNRQLPAGHRAHRKKGFWIIEVEMFSENIRKQYNIQLTLKKNKI